MYIICYLLRTRIQLIYDVSFFFFYIFEEIDVCEYVCVKVVTRNIHEIYIHEMCAVTLFYA